MERTGLITFQGMPLTLVGDGLSAGDKAPDFNLLDNDLGPVSLSDYKGKVCLLVTVPSLDTPVCDMETRRFNEEASTLGADVVGSPGRILRRGLRGARQGAPSVGPRGFRRRSGRDRPVRADRVRDGERAGL